MVYAVESVAAGESIEKEVAFVAAVVVVVAPGGLLWLLVPSLVVVEIVNVEAAAQMFPRVWMDCSFLRPVGRYSK